MKIQSLSIVVPNRACINDCKFCVSKMHNDDYKNQLDHNLPFYDLYLKDYLKRLEFARDNGCNTVMLTGNSEPQQNRHFLMTFGLLNQILEKPFRNIEMQTTGTLIDRNYLRFLRNHVGVNVISLSVSSFDNDENASIIGMKNPIDLAKLCSDIKTYDFTLRLSLNLTNAFDKYSARKIFQTLTQLGADQVTFRVMYISNLDTEQDKWLKEHAVRASLIDEIRDYIATNGRFLNVLEFGAKRYSVNEISTVLDDDCMSTKAKEEIKYLILREDCKLYTKWDDKGSLLF